MISKLFDRRRRELTGRFGNVLLTVCVLALGARHAAAQGFSSGSDGSDGPLLVSGPPGTIVEFNPAQFHGSHVAANIFNFTTITISQGVTVKLSGTLTNGPVSWLSQGDVTIAGTIDVSGGNGHDLTNSPFLRAPSIPGPGGYAGGVGGDEIQAALPGAGPGGGVPSQTSAPPGNYAGGGRFSGNSFLIPLTGGSGGGGGLRSRTSDSYFGTGGGAGGGALLIASSTQIVVNGTIRGWGGNGGSNLGNCCDTEVGAGGSGGAIRLVANTISGTGNINVTGGDGGNAGGNFGKVGLSGQVRLEAFADNFTGTLGGNSLASSPFPLLLPTAAPASARVLSIGGTPITPNPSTFPDITVNTTSPVDVVIQTQNIPTTATVKLTILNQNGAADTVIQAPQLENCTVDNVCTTTVQVIFPFGASRGLTKVTWAQ